MTDRDPRRGLASAAIMARLKECPGALALEHALKSSGLYIEIENPYAAAGTRIHQRIARDGKELPEEYLSRDELRIAEKCSELKRELLNAWAQLADNLGLNRVW
jgi:hypothetical protein